MNDNEDNISLNDLIKNLRNKLNDKTVLNDSPVSDGNVDLNTILNTINNNMNNTDNENNTCDSDFNLFSLLENFSTNDPRKDLLLSLKPFMKKSRQNKIDTYISLLSLSSIFKLSNIFTSESSDKNV